MKRKITLTLFIILVCSTYQLYSQTNVSGLINANTTWNLAGSPYNITADVSINKNYTLTIDPGVVITGNGFKLKVFGTLNAIGTKNQRIIFDNVFISPGNNSSGGPFYVINLDYTKMNGGAVYSFSGAIYGSLNISNSILDGIQYIYLWYPVADCNIVQNVFINSGGLSTGIDNIKVYVKNNVFYNQSTQFAIENWATYNTGMTYVEKNSFLSTNKTALSIPTGYTSANITATNNFWNTTNTTTIDNMIFDANDDPSSAISVNYTPILTSADALTPVYPIFDANIKRGAYPLTVQFQNSSAGNITTWDWDFGDGTTSSLENPSHTYTTDGFYNVKLVITDGNGNTDSIVKTNFIDIGVPPHAGYVRSNEPLCKNNIILLTDTSTGSVTSRTWNITGKITQTSTSNPFDIQCMDSGTYKVQLIVQNSYTTDTFENSFFINPLPVIDAGTYSPICIGDPITLVATGALHYNWFIGTDTVKNDSVTFTPSKSGTYNYTVAAKDANNCTSSSFAVVTVKDLPQVEFDMPLVACGTNDVTITLKQGLPATNTIWGFDGGVITSGFGQGPYNVHWNSLGEKTVSLIVQDNGCNSTQLSKKLTVYQVPTSTFNYTSYVCGQDTATITYTGNASPSATYMWDFANAEIISGTGMGAYQLKWADIGAKAITLTVSENGCTSNFNNIVLNVYKVPTAEFSLPVFTCGTNNIDLVYKGNATSGATYNWAFDGANTVSGSNAGPYVLNWSSTGTKNITLSVSENGCNSVEETKQLSVYQIPTATYTLPDFTCGTNSVNVTYTGNATANATYTWVFDGANIVSGSNAGPYEISWPSLGVKNLSLSVKENGCSSDIISDNITVYQIPTADFTTPGFACGTNNITINYSGNATAAATYTWDFDGANIVSGSNSGPYVVNWADLGSKDITLSVIENGCASNTGLQTITDYNIPTSTFESPTATCRDNTITVTYTGNAASNATYSLSLDGGNIETGSGQGPYTIKWPTGGTKNLGLSVTENGCKSEAYARDVFVQAPYEGEVIAVATFDNETSKNVIVWKKTPGKGTKAFKIYKNTTSGYQVIGTVLYNQKSMFIDTTTNPSEESAKYKLAVVDSCDQESPMSAHHKTMLLTSNTGTAGEVNLIWQHYEGFVFPKYYIYRGTSPTSLTLLKEVAYDLTTTSTKDLNPPTADKLYYQIGVDLPDTIDISGGTKAGDGVYVQSVSNMEDNRLRETNVTKTSTDEFNLSCYPNPFVETVNVTYKLKAKASVSLEVYNILGEKAYTLVKSTQPAGEYNFQFKVNSSGVYYIKLQVNGKTSVNKIVNCK